MKDSFIKVAAASPKLQVADPVYNAGEIVRAAQYATQRGVKLLVTPELSITGYTCGDLFLQPTLLEAAREALQSICAESAGIPLLLVVGCPLVINGKLYNCAAVVYRGRVCGLVPKTNLPNYSEFYELRHFTPAPKEAILLEDLFPYTVPFGSDLLFRCEEMPEFTFAIEICEDLWVPTPPSGRHAVAGANVILNLSASDETIGKAEYRRSLVLGQSARLISGYVYADAGHGESTTDMVFAGHCMVAENGEMLAENTLFEDEMVISEIDLERLGYDRRRISTFPPENSKGYLLVPFHLPDVHKQVLFTRKFSPTPFVPRGKADLGHRCETILAIQAAGLQKRMEHTKVKTAVVGISGGLDSTLALLVTARAMQQMGRSAKDIVAVTMPCFGTTKRTRTNAEKLCKALGVTFMEVDITNTVRSHFADINHEESSRDVVYENAQARVRTLVLMDIANARNGLVIGTGDLSELALGWATYNGDHMSMYAVNTSVPKTLIRYIVAYVAGKDKQLTTVLQDILDTPVSPELLPPDNGDISQKTEELVGPYELHDFYLYYFLRWGYCPDKILRVAQEAFADKYDYDTLRQWLENFLRRFFSQQFKRSCLPDGPKVGSVSLSPRGDWRMPSDAPSCTWLSAIDEE